MSQSTGYLRRLTFGTVSSVLFCALLLGLLPAGCGGCSAVYYPNTLDVTLEGTVPLSYTITLAVPEGQTYSVQCKPNRPAQMPDFSNPSGTCEHQGATFYNFTPSIITATLLWDAQSMSQTVQPVYETHWPDGRYCQSFDTSSISFSVPRKP